MRIIRGVWLCCFTMSVSLRISMKRDVARYNANNSQRIHGQGCSGWRRLCTVQSSARCRLCALGQSTLAIPSEADSIRCLVLVESLGSL